MSANRLRSRLAAEPRPDAAGPPEPRAVTIPPMKGTATVFAPATVANVAVGFDVLGFAIQGPGDTVSVTFRPGAGTIAVSMQLGNPAIAVPVDPDSNTAAVAAASMAREAGLSGSLEIVLVKGIPLGSGLGGSAASAVGAVVALNALLPDPLPPERLLVHALEGERAASGAAHADNAAPCLWGGFTAVLPGDPVEVIPVPVPDGLHAVLVHPHLRLDTREARSILSPTLPLASHVRQGGHLAGVLAACFRNDPALLARHLRDVVVEPQRARLVPGFDRVKEAALEAGALGASLSGSGPSVFAWTRSETEAKRVREAMTAAFGGAGLESDAWISPVGAPGARRTEDP